MFFAVEYREDQLGDGTPCIVAEHPELPGCYGFGADHEEARARLRAARIAYLRTLEELGAALRGARVMASEMSAPSSQWEDGPIETGERYRSTYRIEDGEREVVEELTPIDP